MDISPEDDDTQTRKWVLLCLATAELEHEFPLLHSKLTAQGTLLHKQPKFQEKIRRI
jgi:hypothetical protein